MLPVAARFAFVGAMAGVDGGGDGDAAAGGTPEAVAGEETTAAAFAQKQPVSHTVATAV
jgi:hypothetical protein